jgi:hypothetical protein
MSSNSSSPFPYASPLKPTRTRLSFLAAMTLWAVAGVAYVDGATYNVKNYGAVGDGVSNETSAITAAIAAARAAGSVIYFPKGKYLYSENFTLNGITATGDGPSLTFLIATNSSKSSWTLTGSAPGVTNLAITTKTASTVRNTSQLATGINTYLATGFNIANVYITQVASAGIIVRQSSGASASVYSTIQNCEVSKTLADGINVTDKSTAIEIHDNYLHDAGDDFIAIVSYRSDGGICSNMLVHNNTAERQTGGRGVAVVGAQNVSIYNNKLFNTAGAGVYLASESTYNTYGVQNAYVYNNLIQCCPATAVAGYSSITLLGRAADPTHLADNLSVSNVAVHDNTILNSSTYGIDVDAFTDIIVLLRNNIGVTAIDGIRIVNGANSVTCAGNAINQTGQNGISVQPAATNIEIVADPTTGIGNSICDTRMYGIYVDAQGSSSTVDIVDNSIDSVNLKGTTYVDVIHIDGIATNAKISVIGNRYMNSLGGAVERLIEAIGTPLYQVSGNTSTTVLPTLFTLIPSG